jgi:hypothetical protein
MYQWSSEIPGNTIIKAEDFVFSSCLLTSTSWFQRVSVCTVDLVYSTAVAASSLVLFLKPCFGSICCPGACVFASVLRSVISVGCSVASSVSVLRQWILVLCQAFAVRSCSSFAVVVVVGLVLEAPVERLEFSWGTGWKTWVFFVLVDLSWLFLKHTRKMFDEMSLKKKMLSLFYLWLFLAPFHAFRCVFSS